jgi:hypothetical protein
VSRENIAVRRRHGEILRLFELLILEERESDLVLGSPLKGNFADCPLLRVLFLDE